MSDENSTPVCGLMMPISAIEGLSEKHWLDVQNVLTEAIEAAGYTARLVSDADDVGVIQKRLVQNLYGDLIVVCDVSAKNPNVMFELGMRLAFDKPTIIVKDDQTSFSFDTAQIEHLMYRRDLRYADTVAFKEKLTSKITATIEAAKSPTYTTFLGHFGTFKVADIKTETVPAQNLILSELAQIREMVRTRPSHRIYLGGASSASPLGVSVRYNGDVPDQKEAHNILIGLRALEPELQWHVARAATYFEIEAVSQTKPINHAATLAAISSVMNGRAPDMVGNIP